MFEQTFKNIDDVLWKEAGCATELDYTEQTSWLLFLKYLDDLEQSRVANANLGERKQSLLQKAFSGELTAKESEASVEEAKA
ncbi:type I restriction-modification system subunit M N-terminal domain-containing protein [Halomonas sp. CKK8]|uniref:type I restriction-modification system subunit M N-terminal domain-containing protein n=1 Tax=Halomonas sp. CKK8 TaxID=3036127 RepID=UPI0024158F44|nr:type I restriction-modification system subunit M N-terminal domain-containing protein [Halomonas sp. CKK8]WFM72739.1 type I restriction-modification system subunit M N-terminal domain-containing protein [Halomonas sp. CKK8]